MEPAVFQIVLLRKALAELRNVSGHNHPDHSGDPATWRFSGVGGGPFYGTDYYGGGGLGLVIVILLILILLGRI